MNAIISINLKIVIKSKIMIKIAAVYLGRAAAASIILSNSSTETLPSKSTSAATKALNKSEKFQIIFETSTYKKTQKLIDYGASISNFKKK
jgi:hypothetical protein